MRKRFPAALLAALLIPPALLSGQEGHLPDDSGMAYVEGFYVDRYEFPNQEGASPRANVTWEEAKALCATRGKRLCTEREWQQAASGTEGYAYGYGTEFEPGRCNTPYPEAGQWKRDRGPAPSGSFPRCSTPAGAFDMIGNLWEWVDALYAPGQEWRVVRGGSWFNSVNMARAGYRYGAYLTPDYRLDLIGFRCCRSGAAAEQ